MPEAPTDLPYNFRARLQLYDMTEATCKSLRTIWPIVAPALGEAISSFIKAELEMPTVARIFRAHGAEIGRVETEHMQLLLSGGVGDDYIRSSRHLNSWQAELGLTPRTRIFLGTLILKAALNAFARKTRLSGNAVAKRGRVVAQAIAFDVATSFTLYQDAQATAAERRRIRVAEAIGEFEPTLRILVNSVMGTSDALLQKSADLARGAEATSQRMESASHSSVQMARSIESTSESATALSTSIGEIVRQGEASHDMAQRAARDAETSMVLVESLFQACQQIGSVVDVISRIAQQTNLLALNASIEAARAGMAGRGFGVVAIEVKALSDQTAKATRDIADQIGALQVVAQRSVAQIKCIADAVVQISSFANGMKVSIDAQRSATEQISSSIRHVGEATMCAGEDIHAVRCAASETVTTAEDISAWTERLGHEASELDAKVGGFFASVSAK